MEFPHLCAVQDFLIDLEVENKSKPVVADSMVENISDRRTL
jgi:hypothetical protein